MAISVVVVVGDDTADRMMEQLVPRIETLKVGAYDQDGSNGARYHADARDRIKGYIDRGGRGRGSCRDGRDISISDTSRVLGGATVFDRVKPARIFTAMRYWTGSSAPA